MNPSYVRLWLNLLARTPRVAPFLANNAPIITALHKVRNLPSTYISKDLDLKLFLLNCLHQDPPKMQYHKILNHG